MRRFIYIFYFLACTSFAQVSVNLIQPPPNQLKTNDLWNAILINSTKTILHITISGTLESRGDGIVIEGKSRIISLSPGAKRITYDDIKSGNINYRSSSWGEAYNRTGNAPTGDYTICISVNAEDGREIVSGCIDQTILTPVVADLTPRLNIKLLPLVPNKLMQTDLFKCIVTNLNPVPYDASVITVELRENTTGLQVESKLNSVTIAGTKILSFNDFNAANLIYHNRNLQEGYSKNKNAPDGNYTICVYVKDEKGEVLASDCIDQTILTTVPVDLTPRLTVKLLPLVPNKLMQSDLFKCIVTNLNPVPYNAAVITVELRENSTGLQIESKLNSITIAGTKILSFNDFNIADLNYRNSKLKEAFSKNINAPDGNYTICVYVKNERGEVLASDCIDQNITTIVKENIIPQLITPADGSILDVNQPIIFTWMVQTNNPTANNTFKLKIVEIIGNQEPNNAVKQNPIWYESNELRTTMLQYPLSAKKIDPDKKYAWTVQIINKETQAVDANSGMADAFIFTFRKPISEEKPENISLQLITPIDGSELILNQPILFSWMLSSLKPQTSITYKMKVVEIMWSQSPSEAILRNPAWFDKMDIQTKTLIYPVAGRKFDVNKQYAWQITAFLRNVEIGKSESWRFILNNIELTREIIEEKQCDMFKVSLKKTRHNNTISYKLLITNNYKGKLQSNKPISFRITVKNDSILSIAEGITKDWKRTPSKFPPGSSSVIWRASSGEIPNDSTDLGNLIFRDIYSKPIKIVYEWLDKDEATICKDSTTIIESRIYYELSEEIQNSLIELPDNILNVQYTNNYTTIDDIILSIYDVEKYEFIEPKNKNKIKPIGSDKEIKQITSNGLNRISIDLKEYTLQPKTTYLLIVSANKNNYYLKFKVTNDREK